MTTTQQPTALRAAGEHVVPCEAMRFTCDAQFSKDAVRDRDAKGLREYPVTVVARRGGVVDHWYWGRIVHNLAGVRTKDRVAFDWCHTNDLIGYADQVDASSGQLVLTGALVSVKEDDRADEVGKKGTAGIPYESSIFWDPYTAEIHYLQENATETVNGQTITGPCYVVDAWDLRGQAICPYGVDGQTKTQFSAGLGLPATIPLTVKEALTMTKDSTKPAADAGQPTKDATVGAAGGSQGATTDSTRDQVRGELRRYIDKFGAEAGAKYFADGLSWEAALEAHLDAQSAVIKTAREEAAAAKDKLASVDRGAESASTDSGSGQSQSDNKGKQGLESLVRFASSPR